MPSRDIGQLQIKARHLAMLRTLLAQRAPEVEGWMDVQEAVQESDLPMLVDVHDWAYLPADFHRNIEQEYVVIRNMPGGVDSA